MMWSHLGLFVVPFLIASALPGAAQGSMVAHVLARGRSAAYPFVAGMVSGNAVWLSAAIFGMAALAMRFHEAFVIVKWLGVFYLLFVAWQLWTRPTDVDDGAGRRPSGFLAGLLLTLGNPKAVLFFGAVLPQAFDLTALSPGEALFIVALGVVLDLSVQSLYLGAALRARKYVTQPRHLRRVNRAAAGLIAACAVMVARRN
ncbi:LysE family translocator [Chitinasiproducens palmae]|uniref:Threonine/homoserine/homoserine lactone efflux protein n=1 Tax=Chitinasiproducens palmae TaxID=1770053 RepID=A0A1H2PUB0_9BURK|nr:LysE family translocator [Chitinasiproducens palmae]SDV50748.1 Threonine/homoserine/homoserine lactone efflux protein [Chitinasiproducens palmae]